MKNIGSTPVNFDANASYGPLPEVVVQLRPLLSSLLNPSSIHRGGQKARARIEEARESLRQACGASARDQVVFTSGASEANNFAVSAALDWQKSGELPHALVSSLEHPSLLEPLSLRARRGRIGLLLAHPSDLAARAADADLSFFSLMGANNETGRIFPVADLSTALRALHPRVRIHSDGVQALGKMALDFAALGVDTLSLSGHKVGALPGVGALIIREGTPMTPLIAGGPQEMRLRAGTENVAGIISFGIAARLAAERLRERQDAMRAHAAFITERIRETVSDAVFHEAGADCIPNTISVRIPGINADDLVVALDLAGVFVSAGAACASGKPESSHVLLAMGISETAARETIRISVRADYEEGEVARGAEALVECILRMRGQ